MAKVNFSVTVTGGAGIGVLIKVGGKLLHFENSGTQVVELSPQEYIARVSGSEPSDGSVNVKITQNEKTLKDATFTEPSFWAMLTFTVT